MDAHSLSKFAIASVKPPVIAGTKFCQTLHDKKDDNELDCFVQKHFEEDTMFVNQPEPPNFRKVNQVERVGLQALEVNRDTLTAEFYGKIQKLKKEHQKTLSLLNQYYVTSGGRCHSDIPTYDHFGNKKMNDLVPDYVEYTRHNTLLHGTRPDQEADLVPGFTAKGQVRFKSETESHVRSSENESEEAADADSSHGDSMEVVNQMWENFSLDNYMEKDNKRPVKKNLKVRPTSAPVKQREWSPVITIPEPFNMTLREEMKKGKSHTRSSREVSSRQQQREEEERLELSRQTKARDPPAHIYLPLYDEMKERREQRSRFNKEYSAATLMTTQRPFSFAERDEQKINLKKQKEKEKDQKELIKIKKMSMFEASRVPYSVHDPTVSDKLVEEELYRKIKIKLRSEDLMRMSALPPRMQAHDLMAADKRRKWQHDVDRRTTYSFRPKTHDIPDFDALHKKDELEMFSRKAEQETTVVEPFNLRTSERSKQRSIVRDKELKELEDSWEEDNIRRKRTYSGKSSQFTDSIPPRMTDSARLRIENMRQSLQEADVVIARAKEEERDREERRRNLAHRVAQKSMMNDTSASFATSQDEKLRRYRKELRERQRRYNKFLEEVKQRVDERPLLFEQHAEKVAKAKAEKRFQDILETSGLDNDFVENKTRRSLESDSFEPLSSHDLRSTNDSEVVGVTLRSSTKYDVDGGSSDDESSDDVTDDDTKEDTVVKEVVFA